MAATAAAAAIVLTACVLTACGGSPGSLPSDVSPAGAVSASASARTLSETGSSLMAPLFSLWAPAYHARFSQVTLRTASSSSGEGISFAAAGKANANEGEAALGNSAGSFVLPTARAIQAALASFTNTPASETISLINGSAAPAYPIINYEYAVVNTSQPSATRAQDLRAFLTWAVTSGTEQLAQVNFQPLPSSIVTLSDAQIAKIKG